MAKKSENVDLTGADRVTKQYIISYLSVNHGMSLKEAEKAVNGTIDAIVTALRAGVAVNISNVGTFIPKRASERQARNPVLGVMVTVPEKNVVRWRVSPTLKAVINGELSRDTLAVKASAK